VEKKNIKSLKQLQSIQPLCKARIIIIILITLDELALSHCAKCKSSTQFQTLYNPSPV